MKALRSFLLLLALSSAGTAQFPIGCDIRLALAGTDSIEGADVAMNPKGDFVAGWARRRPDGIARGVFGRLYAADGTPRTGEFRLSEHAADQSWTVRLAMMDDGSFVATFPAVSGSRAAFRRFGADGKPLGGNVVVTREPSSFSTVATRGDGSFVVIWRGPFSDINARAFGTDGEPLGPEVRVADASSDRPELAVNEDGGSFLVVWNDSERVSPSQVDFFLLGRMFEADGTPRGEAFLISDRGDGGIEGFDVAGDWGQYAVTWTRQNAGVAPDSFLRRYGVDGTPLTGVVPRDHRPSGDEIASDDSGGLISIWQSRTLDPDIIIRRYGWYGEPLADDLVRLNQRTAGGQHAPRVAGNGKGSFVAIWQSRVGTKGDGVFARRFIE